MCGHPQTSPLFVRCLDSKCYGIEKNAKIGTKTRGTPFEETLELQSIGIFQTTCRIKHLTDERCAYIRQLAESAHKEINFFCIKSGMIRV